MLGFRFLFVEVTWFAGCFIVLGHLDFVCWTWLGLLGGRVSLLGFVLYNRFQGQFVVSSFRLLGLAFGVC